MIARSRYSRAGAADSWPIDEGGVLAIPGLGRFGGEPSIFAAGVLPVRYSFKCEYAGIDIPAHFAVLRFRDAGSRRRAATRSLLRSGLGAFGRLRGLVKRGSQPCRRGQEKRLPAVH